MAFWLNRSGRQLVRLSSSWATPPQLRLLTCVNNNKNGFSTAASSSPGGMNQKSNPKDDAAFKADLPVTAGEAFGHKLMSAILQKKPLPSPDDPDFHKLVDDLIEKLPDAEVKDAKSETDLSEKNPKATTSEMIKATAVFTDAIVKGLLGKIPKPPAFKVSGDNFNFNFDANGLDLVVKVCGLPKEDLAVWVDRNLVLVASMEDVAPDQKVREAITMPENYNYDPDAVTGSIMEDGQLKISFPASKEGGEPKENYFEVNLV
uniref:uncharacterized protein LOC122589005 n=1 Tax=Erigeron canadensis TaxID=72917 RepID=UPI001CB97AB0|nr:uncharacterized protein LOC122589005 [Erigeron canadensis]